MSECCNGHEHDKKNDDKNNKLDMILTIIGIVIFAFSIYISNLNEIIFSILHDNLFINSIFFISSSICAFIGIK